MDPLQSKRFQQKQHRQDRPLGIPNLMSAYYDVAQSPPFAKRYIIKSRRNANKNYVEINNNQLYSLIREVRVRRSCRLKVTLIFASHCLRIQFNTRSDLFVILL